MRTCLVAERIGEELGLTGSDSPPVARSDAELVARVLPDARLGVLPGQQHVGDVLAPEAFAARLVAFLDGKQTP